VEIDEIGDLGNGEIGDHVWENRDTGKGKQGNN